MRTDEGRGKPRYAQGRRKQPLNLRWPNATSFSIRGEVRKDREPAELKHLIVGGGKESNAIPRVLATEMGRGQSESFLATEMKCGAVHCRIQRGKLFWKARPQSVIAT